MTPSLRRVLALLVVFAAYVTSVAPAAAQEVAVDRGDLERRRGEIETRLAELAGAIATESDAIAAADTELTRLPLELELVANEVAALVVAREEPAEIQLLVTLEAYMEGGTEADGALNDALQLRADIDNVNARELYRSVVERATDDLERIDGQLSDISGEVDRVRGEITDQEELRAAAVTRRDEAIAEQGTLETELTQVNEAIELLEFFSSRARLTGVPSPEINRPALVVKIDNAEAARPQSGINQADIVYEELVEGTTTRFAAVFQSQSPNVVGPIRSVRTTDIDLLSPIGEPLLANSGMNSTTKRLLNDAPIQDIGGLSEFGEEYTRDSSRRAPHNLFGSTVDLWNLVGRTDPPPALLTFREIGEPPTVASEASTGVSIDYGVAEADYTWTGNGWARTQNGTPHVDTGGFRVSPANLIVQFTIYGQSPADRRSPEAIVVGTGDAWIFTDGRLIRGTWSRESETAITYYEVDGERVDLTPGATWIHLVPEGRATLK